MVYKITEELGVNGFSVDALSQIIKRNKGNRSFNTMEHFYIYIVMKDIEMLIDNRKYEIQKGNLVFVPPQKYITCSSDCEREDSVYVFIFSSSFYEKSARDSLLLNSELFFNTSSKIYITPVVGSVENLKKWSLELLLAYKAKQNDGLFIATAHNCVEKLILSGLLFIEQEYIAKENVKNFTSLDIVNKFCVLLEKHYTEKKQVAFYADLLHVTSKRLNQMTGAVLNKTAKQVIIDKIASEGAKILKHSNFTVSKAAYELGFNDQGNFSTFIKKHTQKKPLAIKHSKK